MVGGVQIERGTKKVRGSDDAVSALTPIPEVAPPPKTVRIEDVSELEDGIAILKVRAPWYRLILNGQKTWEIRSTKCEKAAGTAGAMPTALSPTALSHTQLI